MRVLLIGSRNPWRMEAAVERALRRAGHQTLLFDDRRSRRLVGFSLTQRRARRAAARFRPEFVFLSKCLGLSLDTIAHIARDVPNAMWYHDPQWHRDLARPEIGHIAAVGRLASVFFVTGFVDEWRSHILPALFLPAAGAQEIIPVPRDRRFASDVAFIGAGYDAERAQFLRSLSSRVPVRVWGPRWEPWRDKVDWAGRAVEGRDFAAVCSSASIVLGVLPSRAVGATTYASDRVWMTILAGGFYFGPWAAGLDQMLIEEEHWASYRDIDDCARKARYYLTQTAERERIRAAGEAFVRACHTYDARLAFLLSGREWVNPLCSTSS